MRVSVTACYSTFFFFFSYYKQIKTTSALSRVSFEKFYLNTVNLPLWQRKIVEERVSFVIGSLHSLERNRVLVL